MNICPHPSCGKTFDPVSKWGLKKFCSRKCANARVHSPETKKKIGEGVVRTGAKQKTSREDMSRALKAHWVRKRATYAEDILAANFDTLSKNKKRDRILIEQNGCCAICKTTQVWNGQPLRFELDHISGDKRDESRANLRLICPNCHSQTPTYKTKNIGKLKSGVKVTDASYKKALISSKSIYEALGKLRLNYHGGNYKRARRIIKQNPVEMAHLLI